MLHSGWLRPYSQTLGQAGKVCLGQTFYIIANIHKLRTQKSFLTLGAGVNIIKLFFVIIEEEAK